MDLLAGVVKGLPGSGDAAPGLRRRPHERQGPRAAGRHAARRDRAGARGGAIEALRAVKDADELEAIRAAARLADDALTEVLGRGLVGRTEREVALDLEFTMRRMGAQAASFPPIVAAGEHGALPHARRARWRSPRARWSSSTGRAARRLRLGLHAHVRDGRHRPARRPGLRAGAPGPGGRAGGRAPGPHGREVDAVARSIIDAAGHAEHFGHGLGHGVGLDVHEGRGCPSRGRPRWRPGWWSPSSPGSTCPGAVGVRIEDLVIVTDDGAEVVSSLPKELQFVV